jgi:hypothetical protein
VRGRGNCTDVFVIDDLVEGFGHVLGEGRVCELFAESRGIGCIGGASFGSRVFELVKQRVR